MTTDEAYRDISSVLVDLEHNNFMLELEERNSQYSFGPGSRKGTSHEPPIHDVAKCVECKNILRRSEIYKIFQSGKEGICKKCWYHDDI